MREVTPKMVEAARWVLQQCDRGPDCADIHHAIAAALAVAPEPARTAPASPTDEMLAVATDRAQACGLNCTESDMRFVLTEALAAAASDNVPFGADDGMGDLPEEPDDDALTQVAVALEMAESAVRTAIRAVRDALHDREVGAAGERG